MCPGASPSLCHSKTPKRRRFRVRQFDGRRKQRKEEMREKNMEMELRNLKLYIRNQSLREENERLRKQALLLHQENRSLFAQLQHYVL